MPTQEQLSYRRGYARGYNHKLNHRWPDCIPTPPDPIIADLVNALKMLRDAYDGICATFLSDDEIVLKLDPVIEAADESLRKLEKFISEAVFEKEPTT